MKTVIFDMDGVIFDTEKLVKMCWEQVSDKYALGNIDEVFFKCVGTNKSATRRILHEAYGDDFDVSAFFDDTRAIFFEYTSNYGTPKKPYIEELLKSLKKEGYRIGLASSSRYETIVIELRETNLYQYFDEIIGGDQVTNSKPDPEIFLKCLDALSGNKEETYVIEDSYNGIRAASSAGMIPVMVPDLIAPNDEMKNLAAYILENLEQVENLLCS